MAVMCDYAGCGCVIPWRRLWISRNRLLLLLCDSDGRGFSKNYPRPNCWAADFATSLNLRLRFWVSSPFPFPFPFPFPSPSPSPSRSSVERWTWAAELGTGMVGGWFLGKKTAVGSGFWVYVYGFWFLGSWALNLGLINKSKILRELILNELKFYELIMSRIWVVWFVYEPRLNLIKCYANVAPRVIFHGKKIYPYRIFVQNNILYVFL